jgi:hypothetical protein
MGERGRLMTTQSTFRDQALERLKAFLGEPEAIRVTGGEMYRWVLRRPHNLDMYITLDSPEMPDIAHLIVSDPKGMAADPVVSLTMRTLPEVEVTAKKLLEQWKQGMGKES